jgi:hypothetical protein
MGNGGFNIGAPPAQRRSSPNHGRTSRRLTASFHAGRAAARKASTHHQAIQFSGT